MTPAIFWLLIANTAAYLFEIVLLWSGSRLGYATLLKQFGLVPDATVFGLRLWQPVTYLFLHDGYRLSHYLLNMLTLWMFGRDLERSWGTRRFLVFYFLVGAGAGLLNVVGNLAIGRPLVVTIGASGAIYGILMACAVLWPDRQVGLILPPIVMPMKWFVFVWGLIALMGTLVPAEDGTSHFTHLSGMAVAYLYLRRGSLLFRVRNRYSDWQRQRLRKKFEVYMRKQQDNEPPSRPDNWVN